MIFVFCEVYPQKNLLPRSTESMYDHISKTRNIRTIECKLQYNNADIQFNNLNLNKHTVISE